MIAAAAPAPLCVPSWHGVPSRLVQLRGRASRWWGYWETLLGERVQRRLCTNRVSSKQQRQRATRNALVTRKPHLLYDTAPSNFPRHRVRVEGGTGCATMCDFATLSPVHCVGKGGGPCHVWVENQISQEIKDSLHQWERTISRPMHT